MKRFVAVVVSAFMLILVAVDNIIACPACKDSFTSGGANGSVGKPIPGRFSSCWEFR